jgi:hypothetical protein
MVSILVLTINKSSNLYHREPSCRRESSYPVTEFLLCLDLFPVVGFLTYRRFLIFSSSIPLVVKYSCLLSLLPSTLSSVIDIFTERYIVIWAETLLGPW